MSSSSRLSTCLMLAALAVLPACQPSSTAFDPEDPVVIATIDSIANTIRAAAERADVDGVLASAGGTGQFTFVTGDLVLSGVDTVREAFQRTYRLVQRQTVSSGVLWLSLPLALATGAFLWINEFPDARADAAAGKRTLVVRLGRRRAANAFLSGRAPSRW